MFAVMHTAYTMDARCRHVQLQQHLGLFMCFSLCLCVLSVPDRLIVSRCISGGNSFLVLGTKMQVFLHLKCRLLMKFLSIELLYIRNITFAIMLIYCYTGLKEPCFQVTILILFEIKHPEIFRVFSNKETRFEVSYCIRVYCPCSAFSLESVILAIFSPPILLFCISSFDSCALFLLFGFRLFLLLFSASLSFLHSMSVRCNHVS